MMEQLQLGIETLMHLFVWLTAMVAIGAVGALALLGIIIYQVDKIKRQKP